MLIQGKMTRSLGRTLGVLLALVVLSACQGLPWGAQSPADTGRPNASQGGRTSDSVSQEYGAEPQAAGSNAPKPPDAAAGKGDGALASGRGAVKPDPSAAGSAASPAPKPQASRAVLIAVGDVMVHDNELAAARDPARKGSYDFSPFFKGAESILQSGDWVTANLETTLSGQTDGGYTGYPRFNSPASLAAALRGAGFTIITTANNHAMDRGADGVAATLAHLHAQGLITAGTAASQAEANERKIVERKGIKLGVLAYTFGTNGIPIPENKPYLVSLIDEAKMKADIAGLRQAGADIISVSIHWGYEYHEEPNVTQERLAKELIADGADIILGSHPHVVQPYQWILAKDQTGKEHQGVVIYSMGNFISDQNHFYPPYKPTDQGLIFRVTIWKDPSGLSRVEGVEPIPTYVQRYSRNGRLHYRIIPIRAALTAPHDDPLLTKHDYRMLQSIYQKLTDRLHGMPPETVAVDSLPSD